MNVLEAFQEGRAVKLGEHGWFLFHEGRLYRRRALDDGASWVPAETFGLGQFLRVLPVARGE